MTVTVALPLRTTQDRAAAFNLGARADAIGHLTGAAGLKARQALRADAYRFAAELSRGPSR